MEQPFFSVSDFVAVFNQTVEYAYPSVTIVGELANFKVSKNRWIYFDLKDEFSSIRFFGSIYSLPGPLEDGMQLQVTGSPRLHQQFGFSVTAQTITPVGEGSLKKAADLLKAKLTKEGLFDVERKRALPYPPSKIGLIASGESAAYVDFNKIINQRWSGIEIFHQDVQVQGESAPGQIVQAIEKMNTHNEIEILVITRGGGSKDDLAAFDNEAVVRAIAASRTPTLVAIGHEIDFSLSELAADVRASTPSNAAEMIVPDRKFIKSSLVNELKSIRQILDSSIKTINQDNKSSLDTILQSMKYKIEQARNSLKQDELLLKSYNPKDVLKRGYALALKNGQYVKDVSSFKTGDQIEVQFRKGKIFGQINKIEL